MQFTQAEIDRMMTNYDNFHELQREQIMDLTMAIHNLTIERNEKIDRLTIVSKERDRLREVLAAIVTNLPTHRDWLDPGIEALARELIAPKQPFSMVEYAEKVCMGANRG